MVKIKNITLISKEAKETEIIITDGIYELICFCQPCNKKIGEDILEEFYCFNNKSAIKVEKNIYAIEKMIEPFAYFLTGKVHNKKRNIINIGEILLRLEDNTIPSDIEENDYVSFYVQRIDLY